MRLAAVLPIAACFLGCTGAPVERPPKPPLVRLQFNRFLFAGDVMLSRGVRQAILEAGDPALPFRKIAPLMTSADLAFVNLESPFSDDAPYHEGGLVFHAPPAAIAGLELARIAVASTANNHARDCGPHGVEFTVKWLCAHGVQPVGSSLSAAQTHHGIVVVRNGLRFGFLGYTYDQQNGNWRDIDERIAVADPAVVKTDVRELLRRSDVVIVSMHGGTEYASKPNKAQIEVAHAAIDAGAALVVGHHPHVIQPKEIYRGRLIFYSLGNFVFDQFQRDATQHGEIAEVDFLGKQIFADYVWPVKITRTGPEMQTK